MSDSTTGRINDYTDATFGPASRALNRTEKDARIQLMEATMETRIEQVYEEMAQHFLTLLREMIAPFNTRRHVITVSASMGLAAIHVDGELLENYTLNTPVVARLKEIEQLLEGGWHWAAYLDGECLNPTIPQETLK